MDILNHKSESLLSISASHGHEKVVQWLVMKKAAINHKTLENCTPLFLASMKGHHEVVKFLLKMRVSNAWHSITLGQINIRTICRFPL